MYFHFVIILMIISQCSDIIFVLYKTTKPIIKLSIYMYIIMLIEYACELFFYKLPMQNYRESVFLLNFLNVNIEKNLFSPCHMHAHDFSTPVHNLSF